MTMRLLSKGLIGHPRPSDRGTKGDGAGAASLGWQNRIRPISYVERSPPPPKSGTSTNTDSNADRVLADRRPSASRRRPLRPRRRHAVLATTARSQRHSHRSHAHDDASTRGICETKESPTIATIAVRHHCGCSHPKDKSRARKTSLLLPQQKPARACWRPRTVGHGDERPKFVGGSTICSGSVLSDSAARS